MITLLRRFLLHLTSERVKTYVFYFFIFCLPFQLGTFFFIKDAYIFGVRSDYLAPSIFLSDILAAILIILYRPTPTLNKQAVLLICGLAISCFFTHSPLVALFRCIKWLELLLIFYICQRAQMDKNHIVLLFLLGGLLELGISIGQIINNGSLQGIWYYFGERFFTSSTPGIAKVTINGVEIVRPYGSFSHPNALAGFYTLLFVAMGIYAKKTHPIVVGLIQFINISLIFFSFSKNAFLTWILSTFAPIMRIKSQCWFCLLTKIIFVAVLGFISLTASGDPQTLTKRWYLLQSSLTIFSTHFLFGVGPGNYLYAQSLIPNHFPYYFLEPVHNIYLLLLSEIGFVNMIILMMMGAKTFLKLWRSELQILLFVIVVTGFFDHYWLTQQQNMLLIPVLFGLFQRHNV